MEIKKEVLDELIKGRHQYQVRKPPPDHVFGRVYRTPKK
jgi:hypothetical protein